MTQGGALVGQARQLGILGHPVGHSISPAMHNAAFRAQSMNAVYGAFDVEPSCLGAAVEGIRALGFLGVNVTIPHKEAVIPFLDEVAPTARQVGAVNTIVNRGGRLIGYNTDGWGFISSLEEYRIKVTGIHAVVLGAGGASRAVAMHLAMAGVRRLTISNRTPERAEALATEVSRVEGRVAVGAVEAGSSEERRALMDAGLVVNCTPLGMHPDVTSTPIEEINLLPQGAVVYDTVYRPMETRLLREARIRGLHVLSGLSMLVHQGACAWEYWFGRRGPVPVMHAAALAALEGRE
ncbi:MAG: shikimate dehydrogenase [Bacillota bacterium]